MILPLAFSWGVVPDAIEAFVDHIESVHWGALGLVVVCHLAKVLCVSRAWRNAVVAAYPEQDVPYRSLLGAYCAGVGVNAVSPARGGDVVRIAVTKHSLPHSTYTTLAATLTVPAIFDAFVAVSLFSWALANNILPSRQILSHTPDFDFSWFFNNPRQTLYILGIVSLLLTALILWVWRSVDEFKQKLWQGIAALRNRRYYFLHVVPFQILDWTFRGCTIFFALRAFGLDATAYNVLLVQATASLATLFPFSPAGIGTEQAFLLYTLRDLGSRSAILGFGFGYKLTIMAVNIVLGFASLFLIFGSFRFRHLIASARAGHHPPHAPADATED